MVYRRVERRRFVVKSRREARLRAVLLLLFALVCVALVGLIMSQVGISDIARSLDSMMPYVPSGNAMLS